VRFFRVVAQSVPQLLSRSVHPIFEINESMFGPEAFLKFSASADLPSFSASTFSKRSGRTWILTRVPPLLSCPEGRSTSYGPKANEG